MSDTCSSVLQYMGLNFISGSTYLMFKGASIVTTALFSKLLFGMVIQKRHIVGCGSAVAGLIVVGASGFINQSGSSSDMVRVLLNVVEWDFGVCADAHLASIQWLPIRVRTAVNEKAFHQPDPDGRMLRLLWVGVHHIHCTLSIADSMRHGRQTLRIRYLQQSLLLTNR